MSKRTYSSIWTLLIIMMIFHTNLIWKPVEAGKKSLLMGLVLGAALRGKGNDHLQLFHVLIPLKLATEAWKHYGKHSAYQEQYQYQDYGGVGHYHRPTGYGYFHR